MRRVLGVLAASLALVMSTATAGAGAEPAGGGTPRWTSSYDYGAPAYTSAVALTPDGSTVVETGLTHLPGGHMATVAYDATTGARSWSAEFPARDDDFGSGDVVITSPDGSTAYVGGSTRCMRNCDTSSFHGWVIVAYDVGTGDRLWLSRLASEGGGPHSLAVSPDAAQLFANGTDGNQTTTVVALDAATGDRDWTVEGVNAVGYYGGGASVSPDGSTLYVSDTAVGDNLYCSADGFRTTAYRTSDGVVDWTSTYQLSDKDAICGTATDQQLSPDGSTVYVTGYGGDGSGVHTGRYRAGTVAYDAATGSQIWAVNDDTIDTLAGDTKVSLGVDPDGSRVFISGDDCTSYPSCTWGTVAYDAATGARDWVSHYDAGGRGFSADLAVSPDGSGLYITGQMQMPCYAGCTSREQDAPLVSYDLATGDERWATTFPNNSGSALAVSPDGASVYLAGTFLASASTSRGKACTDRCGYATTRFNTRSGPGTFQDPVTALAYDGWRGVFDKNAVGGAYRESHRAGAAATFTTPKATTVAWLTRRGPNQGKARVVVDGRSKVVDLYAAKAAAHTYTFDGLAKRAHTITVKVLGKKASASTATWVAVDGFTFHAGSGLAEESASHVRFDRWAGVANAHASGGSFRRSGSRSAAVSLDFKGRTVRWVTATGPMYGRARVVIDGRAHTVDLYRASRHWKAGFTFANLARGEHDLTIRPLGRKDHASRSTAVVVDALVVHRR
jgi:hypothetical protein